MTDDEVVADNDAVTTEAVRPSQITPAGQTYDSRFTETFGKGRALVLILDMVKTARDNALLAADDADINAFLNKSEVKSIFTQLTNCLDNAIPFAVCAKCLGTKAYRGKKCDACRGHGWTNRRTHKLILKSQE